jgi:hypothetical protein
MPGATDNDWWPVCSEGPHAHASTTVAPLATTVRMPSVLSPDCQAKVIRSAGEPGRSTPRPPTNRPVTPTRHSARTSPIKVSADTSGSFTSYPANPLT